MRCPPGSHYCFGVVKGWGRGHTHPHLGSARARTGCLTHSGTCPHSGETGAQVLKGPVPALGEALVSPLGSRCFPQPVGSTGQRAGTQLQGWALEVCLYHCSAPPPMVSFPDPRHSASLPLLTSGQNPCIWFSVTIILVMMTKTEVPLGGEEEREQSATLPLRGGAVAIPTLQVRKPRLRLRDLAEVMWLRTGGGGVHTRLFRPPISSPLLPLCVTPDHRTSCGRAREEDQGCAQARPKPPHTPPLPRGRGALDH